MKKLTETLRMIEAEELVLEVMYPARDHYAGGVDLDDQIKKLGGPRQFHGSGIGGGVRDATFGYKSKAEAEAAEKRIKAKLGSKVKTRIFPMSYDD